MKIKINRTELFVALLLAPFFTFAIGLKWPLLGIAVNCWRYLALIGCIIFIIYQKSIGFFLKEKAFIVLLIFYLSLLLSTLLAGDSALNAVQLSMYGIVPFLVIGIFSKSDKGCLNILGGFNLMFLALIVINFFIIIFYPHGIYSTYSSGRDVYYYLFGEKNQSVAPILTGMVFFIEYSLKKYNGITVETLLKCSLCFLEIILEGSGTGLAVSTIFLIIAFFRTNINRRIIINASLIVFVILLVGVVFFQIQNLFSFLIVDIMNKDVTLTNRIYIWETAIAILLQHPILGIGVSPSLSGKIELKLDYVEKSTFAHNMYLDFGIMGGIIAIVLFAVFIMMLRKKCVSIISFSKNTIIWWGVFVYLIAGIFDIYTGHFCLFLMAAYICSLSSQIKSGLVELDTTHKYKKIIRVTKG